MPVMGAVEATRRIREAELKTGTHTPIIAMTAHAMTGDAEKYLQAGKDGYVSKPIEVNLLRAQIDRLTKKTELGQENSARDSPVSTFDHRELLVRVENDRELLHDLLKIFKEEFPR
jgi:two-component system sensor histidine kinase/response regulator